MGRARFLVDTGSQCNLISLNVLSDDVEIHLYDRVMITGVTSNQIESTGAVYLKILGVIAKFHALGVPLPLDGDGILGLEFLRSEKAEISFHHDTLVIDNDPIKPIPFLSSYDTEKNLNNVSSTDRLSLPAADIDNSESKSSVVYVIKARNRQVISIPVKNKALSEGYLPLVESHEGLFVGNAAVSVQNGKCKVLAINPTEEDIEVRIEPQELTPYDVFDEEADDLIDILQSEREPLESLDERVNIILNKVKAHQLGEHRRRRVERYLRKFPYLFLLNGDKFLGTDLTMHDIPTVDDVPINSKQYRYPPVHKAEVRRQITKLLEARVIGPSSSPYNSPLWIVPKKADEHGNKRWRLVIDFRKLNEKTVGDAYPLLNINEILDHVGGAKYFSVFDLAMGFHQIPMNPRDRQKTAFTTNNGHYEYLRMPFGLKGAPATFQRLMDRVLIGLQGVELFVYIDDIVVYASSLDEHDAKIDRLFTRLSNAGLRLEPEKCTFLSTEVAYLRHIISEDGVRPNPKKIEAVKQFPVPRSARNIKEFLGLVGYYRRFVSNMAQRAKPLTELLKKFKRFEWGEEQQRAFEDLRDCLCAESILQCPDFEKPFVLTTNASNIAIAAVLSQGKIGEDLPISFASRALTKAEINYSVTERECLAVVYFTKYFSHYLYGKKFTIMTDHEALKWLYRTQDPSPRLVRWRLRMMDYKYTIQHKPGKINKNADALSRNPITETMEITVLPLQIQKRKPGRPPKSRGPQPSSTPERHGHIENAISENAGIADRVKQRRQILPRPRYEEEPIDPLPKSATLKRQHPSFSYSSDDEADHCVISGRKTRKRKGRRKRLLRSLDSEYIPPSSYEPVNLDEVFSDRFLPSSEVLSEEREFHSREHDKEGDRETLTEFHPAVIELSAYPSASDSDLEETIV